MTRKIFKILSAESYLQKSGIVIRKSFRSIADKSETLQEQYILRYCQKEKEKEKKEKKETVHMKNQEWAENGRKLNLCAADDERLKTLLEKDVQVVFIKLYIL